MLVSCSIRGLSEGKALPIVTALDCFRLARSRASFGKSRQTMSLASTRSATRTSVEPKSTQPRPQPRVVAAYAQAFWDYAAELRLDLSAAPATSRRGEDLSPEAYIALLELAGAQAGEHFGLDLGTRLRLPHYAVYGMSLLSARDLREAVLQVMRYESLAHDLGRSQLIEGEEEAIYRWHSPWLAQAPCRHLAESVFAGIAVFVRWLLHADVHANCVQFTHAAPADLTPYHALFSADIQFNAKSNAIVFPRALLAQTLPNADPSLQSTLTAYAEQLLLARRQKPEPALISDLKKIICRHLASGELTLTLLAQELQRSPRGLQRDLAKLSLSFQQVLDQTRQELAQDYLRQPQLGLTEIAFLLGYSEHSTFTHAFRQWQGVSPKQWRQQQREINR